MKHRIAQIGATEAEGKLLPRLGGALKAAAMNETAAVEFMERQRWGDAPACPWCGDVDVYKMLTTDGRRKDYRWRCKGCRRMFTVRIGTIFEQSRLPLRVWVCAFWKACSSKQESASFVLRRIRYGLGAAGNKQQLKQAQFYENHVATDT